MDLFHGLYSLLDKFSFEMSSGELLQWFFSISYLYLDALVFTNI